MKNFTTQIRKAASNGTLLLTFRQYLILESLPLNFHFPALLNWAHFLQKKMLQMAFAKLFYDSDGQYKILYHGNPFLLPNLKIRIQSYLSTLIFVGVLLVKITVFSQLSFTYSLAVFLPVEALLYTYFSLVLKATWLSVLENLVHRNV